jgi:hypothetical protein
LLYLHQGDCWQCHPNQRMLHPWQIVVSLNYWCSSGWFTSCSWLVGWLSTTTMCSSSLIYLLDLWGAMEELTAGNQAIILDERCSVMPLKCLCFVGGGYGTRTSQLPTSFWLWQDSHSLAFIQTHCLSFCQPSIFTSYPEF